MPQRSEYPVMLLPRGPLPGLGQRYWPSMPGKFTPVRPGTAVTYGLPKQDGCFSNVRQRYLMSDTERRSVTAVERRGGKEKACLSRQRHH